MAKSKAGQKHGQASAGNGGESPEQLYASALALAEQSQFEEALEEAQKLWARVKESSVTQKLPALNLLGEISVELGDVERAQEYFMEAVKLDPEGTIPETVGGGAEKFLWLAQLCEEGGNVSVQWFEKGAQALQHEISELENGTNGGLDDETIMMMRIEKKKKLANALCGIIEVYMTDLSWEDDAEARCEMLITQAMSVEEETSPEVLQTLASIRLSQERKEDAQAALKRSITSWEELEPEDPAVPDFATRISLARLLMEADLESTAMSVIERLVTEDDSSVEAWYLGGWCQHLIAERLRTSASSQATSDSADAVTIALKASRHWLRQSLKLYALLEYEDDRLFAHAQELVSELDQTLGPAEDTNDDIFEEWDGIEENNADATNDDEEMQDL